jgi:CO dehydrogenase/acetyl-CoA synthase gamma subunit (corrinoid Fe-S protein)
MAVGMEVADLYRLTEESLLPYLSDTDCEDCGHPSCVAFAEELLQGNAEARRCSQMNPRMAEIVDALLKFPVPTLPFNVMMETFPPGLVKFGSPEPSSPVLVTCNFQGTVRLLEQIAGVAEMSAYLVMSDTKGYSVDNAVVEKRFTPFEIARAINETEIGSMVSHRSLVIPGLAKHLASQIRMITGWEIVVGPVSGFEVPLFLLSEKMSI